MAGKVILEVTMGELNGEFFTYEEPDRVFVGRQEDCGIVLPERTVSRYHCLLNINPPAVGLQDFGSLNGTFLNEKMIGRREKDQSREEAGGGAHDEYELHDGDRIRLGRSCELRCRIELPEQDATVFDENPEEAEDQGTIADTYPSEEGERKADQEAAGTAEEEAAKRKAEEEAEKRRAAEKAREKAEEDAKRRAVQEAAWMALEEERRREEEKAARQRAAEEEKRKAAEEAARQRAAEEEKRKAAEEAARQRAAEEERRKAAEEAARQRAAEEEKRKAAEEAARQRAAEEEKKKAAAAQAAARIRKPTLEKKKCRGCGKMFVPASPDNNLCSDCMADQGKILDDILAALIVGALAQKETAAGPSPVEGYDKVSLLGKGGMGEVWKVREKKTGKILALKTMLPEVAADEKAKRMFLREAGICEHLNHKNVVRTYQTGCTDGVFYILMDLCPGGSVDELMKKKGGKLPLNLATYIILQALDGLDYVHNVDVETEIKKKGLFGGKRLVEAKGLVHRDFKPGNIFLSDKSDHPVAMVADFGMAKAFQTAGLTDMSAPGQARGTVPFMPRQQVLDCRFAKPEVDVWAAAASYYNMLTGAIPKNLKPGPLLWQGLVTESAVPIRRRDPSVPARIAEVIDRALVEKPQIGCQSAAEFRKQLVAALPAETRNYCRSILR